jgi:predicted O-linked N-acetylglucosamine transferase (SPINDLY family)
MAPADDLPNAAEQAVLQCQRALQGQSTNAILHNDLGNALLKLGRYDQAAASYLQALQLNPGLVLCQLNLALALRGQGKLAEAVDRVRHAIACQPLLPQGYFELGAALQQQGQAEDAIIAYRQALALKPDFAHACTRLCDMLQQHGRLQEAVTSYRMVLRNLPTWVEGYCDLGNTLRMQRLWDHADDCFVEALRLNPQCAGAHYLRGLLYADQKELEKAAECYRQALHIQPDMAEAHAGLGVVLDGLGQEVEAQARFEKALQLQPRGSWQIAVASRLPGVYQSLEDMRWWRGRLSRGLRRLRGQGVIVDLTNELARPLSGLAYHGLSDRDIQRDLAALYRAPAQANTSRPACWNGSRRIKIGLVSAFFRRHTIGHLTRGLVAQLGRREFEVSVLSVGRWEDDIAEFIRQHADHHIVIPAHLSQARHLIAEQQLDVLYYTDCGLAPLTYTLAFSRLAPVQCVTWGHPDTSGLPTIDYFISSEDLETEEADQEYTESLIRLKGLPIYYYRPELESHHKQRADFGLADNTHLYACPQTLLKFHPEFDSILASILRGDPRAELVLVRGQVGAWEHLLRRRFSTSMPDVMHRIQFLPMLAHQDYLSLLAAVDVMLDPLHFGGGNTSYEAFAWGTPVVTLPSQHLRGRITYALYKQMGVLDCVTHSAQDYIDKALRLGTDQHYRAVVRAKILAACDEIYENAQGIRDLEQFLRRAVLAASGTQANGEQ